MIPEGIDLTTGTTVTAGWVRAVAVRRLLLGDDPVDVARFLRRFIDRIAAR